MHTITTNDTPTSGLRGIGDTSWHARAVCQGMDPEEADAVFFPLPREHAAIAEAKALCARCPVRGDCLNHALEHDHRDGIWGGLTEAERRPWHKGLPQRLDYTRILAVFDGRDVHLTAQERQVVIDHAYARGWRADRLAVALQVSQEHARDLLTQAAHKVFDRDLTHGVPPRLKKQMRQRPKAGQATEQPADPVSRHASGGKAA